MSDWYKKKRMQQFAELNEEKRPAPKLPEGYRDDRCPKRARYFYEKHKLKELTEDQKAKNLEHNTDIGPHPAPKLPEGVTRKDRAGVIDYAITCTGVNRVTILKNRSLENIQLHIDCLTYEKHLRENQDK